MRSKFRKTRAPATEISVILPVLNGAATIERALRSTLRALPASSELVVVDDGCTDRTVEIVNGVADQRIVVVNNQGAAGVANALNAGIGVAHGRYIARMDADDVTFAYRFQVQLSRLRRGDDISFGTVIKFGTGIGSVRPTLPVTISPEMFPAFLAVENPVAHSTMCARADVLHALGGYRDVAAEDYDLWIRAALSGVKMRRLALPLIAYRVHAGQVSGDPNWRAAAEADPRVTSGLRALRELAPVRPGGGHGRDLPARLYLQRRMRRAGAES